MTRIRPAQPVAPVGSSRPMLCPYCGSVSANPKRCDRCGGHFDPLSRQATQNAMGPWYIRDLANPTRPGCSYETLKDLIQRGKVTRETILRGPATRQFWNFAGRTPSVANLLGVCHNCQREVSRESQSCGLCGAGFAPEADRQHLGLAPVHLLPGQATPETIAAVSIQERRPPGPASPGGVEPLVVSQVTGSIASPRPERRSGSPAKAVAIGVGCVVLGAAIATAVFMSPLLDGAAPQPVVSQPPAPNDPARSPDALPAGQPEAPAAPAVEDSGPAPEPAPPPEPAEGGEDRGGVSSLVSELLPMVTSGPIDQAATGKVIESAAAADSSIDPEAWRRWVERRQSQLSLRRIP